MNDCFVKCCSTQSSQNWLIRSGRTADAKQTDQNYENLNPIINLLLNIWKLTYYQKSIILGVKNKLIIKKISRLYKLYSKPEDAEATVKNDNNSKSRITYYNLSLRN